ncbi:L,D-transpeptidase [Neobacillus sp. LXY-4]|uniref:L,D-transpeptidase n=1 Tax=Neobacillus sp. LXY-4 TaxID=3379826 RepID=UPI003EE099B9
MVSYISAFILALSLSPLWPLGPNPIPGDPFIIVNKQTNQVAFIDENRVQTIIGAATGYTSELTPEGLFTVTVKAVNPYYRKKNIVGGDPNNPLGTRWIGFDANDTDGRIYGIHGTNQPESIGKYVSNGCIRLQNQAIEALYDFIPLGTKILILTTPKNFEQLAKEYGAIH